MSRMIEFRLSSCAGKQELSLARARLIAQRMRHKGQAVSAYKCRLCDAWHVGSQKRIKRCGR